MARLPEADLYSVAGCSPPRSPAEAAARRVRRADGAPGVGHRRGRVRLRVPLPLARRRGARAAGRDAHPLHGFAFVALGAALTLRTANDVTSALLAGALQLVTLPVAANLIAPSAYWSHGIPRGPDTVDELHDLVDGD